MTQPRSAGELPDTLVDPVGGCIGTLRAWKDLAGWADGGWNLPPHGTESLERITSRAAELLESLQRELAEARASVAAEPVIQHSARPSTAHPPEGWRCMCSHLNRPEAAECALAAIEDPREILASRLIDAWFADKGKQIPWAKAVQITAIVTKQTDEERDRLLRMGDDADGKCEMCGRSDAAPVAAEGRAELVKLQAVIAALEGSAANTDTDPRWLAAKELRNVTHWEAATIRLAAPAAPGMRLVPEWVDVSEKLPPDTKAVLVRCPERQNTYVAYFREGEWRHFGGSGYEVVEEISHWQPLPTPPEAAAKGRAS